MSYFDIQDITVSFGGVKALNNVSFSVDQGEDGTWITIFKRQNKPNTSSKNGKTSYKMKICIIFLLLLPLFSSGQNQKNPKNYISIGFLDHKTGNSAIGYTRSILQNKNKLKHTLLLIGFELRNLLSEMKFWSPFNRLP